MMAMPIALYWGLALWGLSSRKPVLFYLFLGSIPFGAFATIPTALTGGLTLVPATMTAMLIVLKQLGSARGIDFFVANALSRHRMLFLFLFWLVATCVTALAPRYFAGEIVIVPMRATLPGFMQTALLSPTTQNFSQFAYVTVSVFSAFAFLRLLSDPTNRSRFLTAWLIGAAATILTGFLDLAGQFLPLGFLLEPFRTASYALLTDASIEGSKRVVGLMPEASAYGAVCMTFLSGLYFYRRAIEAPGQRRLANLLLAGLALFTVLSTSSAAYVGIAVLGLIVAFDWLYRAVWLPRGAVERRGLLPEFLVGYGILCLLAAAYVLMPRLFDPAIEMVDILVFQKTGSSSYEERSMWTAVSLQAGIDSGFLGVGLGATRASNIAVAIFSNTGLLGFLLYVGFVLQCFLCRADPADRVATQLVRGAQWSFLPGLAVGLLIGTTADFGTGTALRWGLIMALGSALPVMAGRASSGRPGGFARQ